MSLLSTLPGPGTRVQMVDAWPRHDDVLKSRAMKLPALFSLLVLSVGVGTAQDDAKAQTKLGTDYLLGRGVEQDRDQGFKLIRGAAEKGGAEAQRILGNLYEYGVGAPINLKESAKWRRKAAGQGDGKAFLWMRRAAEQGDPEGQAALGDMYGAGSGVTKNPEQAARWHQQAAAQGHPGAQFAYGQACATGSGVDRNVTQALRGSPLQSTRGTVQLRTRLSPPSRARPPPGKLPRAPSSLKPGSPGRRSDNPTPAYPSCSTLR